MGGVLCLICSTQFMKSKPLHLGWHFFGLFLSIGAACLFGAEAEGGEFDFFEKEVRPVLVERCYECHSATTK
jgi:hypothetical protein